MGPNEGVEPGSVAADLRTAVWRPLWYSGFYCFVFVLDLRRMMERLSEGGALNAGTHSYKLSIQWQTHVHTLYIQIYILHQM